MVVYRKRTKEELAPIVASSYSIREVLFKLGLRETGGSYSNMRKRIEECELDMSHFLGQGHMKGKRSLNRKTAQEVLVCGKMGEPKVETARLRRALDDIGRERVCEWCGVGSEYNGLPIILQVDHINGQRWDNRADNLRYLCPNCHSQTETFGSRNNKNALVAERLTQQNESLSPLQE